MSFEILNNQILELIGYFNIVLSQLLLFIVGLSVSIFFAYYFLSYVETYECLGWYILGIIIPLVPSMLNWEDV
jgi:hypothetical protein